MSKIGKRTGGREATGEGQLWLRLPGMVREALYETVIVTGVAWVDEVPEAERAALCGTRYEHQTDGQALRGGPACRVVAGRHVASSLVLGGPACADAAGGRRKNPFIAFQQLGRA